MEFYLSTSYDTKSEFADKLAAYRKRLRREHVKARFGRIRDDDGDVLLRLDEASLSGAERIAQAQGLRLCRME